MPYTVQQDKHVNRPISDDEFAHKLTASTFLFPGKRNFKKSGLVDGQDQNSIH